ncbi:MAG: hypothetical protein IT176_05625 [Acidobacteria bacterium]|nr:hypothetical protein [Acidobacteriota bacterium]
MAARPSPEPARPANQTARRDTTAAERVRPIAAPRAPSAAGAPEALPDTAATAHADEPAAPEPAPAASAAEPAREELVVAADSVIGLQTRTSITTETAHVEDRIEAHVTRAVRVDDRVAIPAGAKALGSVTLVERGGKFKEQARLGIRFHTLVLDDGTEVPISTETIYRVGEAPSAAQKVGGGAVGGAILGAILGGGKGAVLGGLAGAGGGAAVAMASDSHPAQLAAGAPLTIRLISPVTVTVDSKD